MTKHTQHLPAQPDALTESLDRYEAMVDALRASGRRLTPQRLAIVQELARSIQHPSAEELHDIIRVQFPTVSLATVYNTLHMLHEEGLIHKLSTGTDTKRYDGRTPTPHPHCICTACGRVDDCGDPQTNETMRQQVETMARDHNFIPATHNLEIFGLCHRCKGPKD